MVPEYYEARETRYWEDENGQKWRSLGNICWFTKYSLQGTTQGNGLTGGVPPVRFSM